MPKISWPQVTLFLGMFLIATLGACVLLAMDKDVSTLLSLVALLAVPVLTAAGAAVYQKMDQVKEQSNGNMSRLMETNNQNMNRLVDVVQGHTEQMAKMALLLPTTTDPEVLKPTSPMAIDATAEINPWPR